MKILSSFELLHTVRLCRVYIFEGQTNLNLDSVDYDLSPCGI